MPSPFPMQFGPYTLERFIAAGGMAEVFLAKRTDGAIKGPICVKRMLPEMMKSQEYVVMFQDEARLSETLEHPNVVRVYDCGEIDGRLYMAMEYVDGMDVGTLQKKLRQRGEMLGVGHALKIGIDLCAGLHYAHNLGIDLIHRDVSPQNIMVSQDGDVKVGDFGIAKATGRETHTQTGLIKGKVSYMAPEQALGQAIDQRVDQFAAGIVVWELVTGQRLYAEKSDNLNFEKIIRQPPPKPSAARSGIPPIVDGVILRALAKRPQDRYPDCNTFGLALQQALVSMGAAAKTDLGAVMAHVLGIPPKELREANRPRAAVAAPPPQMTSSGAPLPQQRPQPRRGGGLQVTSAKTSDLSEAPTMMTPPKSSAANARAEPERLPTNAMMPLPAPTPHVKTETGVTPHIGSIPTSASGDPSTIPDDDNNDVAGNSSDTLYDPSAPGNGAGAAGRTASFTASPDIGLELSAEGAVTTPNPQPPAVSPRVPSNPRISVVERSKPEQARAEFPPIPVQEPSAVASSPPRSFPIAAVAGAVVAGLVLGFGIAKVTSSSTPRDNSGCPLSSPDARGKADALFTQAQDAYKNGDKASADKLLEQSALASGTARAEALRGRIALERGARVDAMTHFRCAVALDPGGEDAGNLERLLLAK